MTDWAIRGLPRTKFTCVGELGEYTLHTEKRDENASEL
jgi:hypothetical protein